MQFWHPDYNPDLTKKLISSSMSRYLSTRNISSKSMHAFLSNLANKQTEKHGQKHLPPPLLEVNNILTGKRACRRVANDILQHGRRRFSSSDPASVIVR